ncbi:lipoyl(octanoyl) transferase [Anseongella ginsenosidimutans]|uniref:Octanoyltransferase n=1 Tax=Anseongella ginsenosidimutans TaxID=496056 RepID=A0A4R3KX70_9SPHI|nr:lipoyl(octanoyl) transferase LipB [Anseongella ginsenosidimutans]QEC51306.1 lipoyl(octanoyl) transferase LipB [Anseongella ginsenosidimutans]TCS90001.1 lipoyl(octanoyl) transferase [Anseongella ginsenosidimutans]
MKEVIFEDWGLVDYQEAWNRQEALFNETVRIKTENRQRESRDIAGTSVPAAGKAHASPLSPTSNYLIFCEHPHVFTLGKSGKVDHLLLDEEALGKVNASFYKINRGGDITYHGPGQIVGYPILDLDHFFTDIHRYLRTLEEAVILTLKEYGVDAGRIQGLTGVWLDPDRPEKSRKICALGVRCSRWVSMHGFAFNVNVDTGYFNHIVPCGIDDKKVTSLHLELGKSLDVRETKEILKGKIAGLFDMSLIRNANLPAHA